LQNSCVKCRDAAFLFVDLLEGIENALVLALVGGRGGLAELPLDLETGYYEVEGVDR
jgi:hypothetical protein